MILLLSYNQCRGSTTASVYLRIYQYENMWLAAAVVL